jgi:cell division transport system permease protein
VKAYYALKLIAYGLQRRPIVSLLALMACWFASCQLAVALLALDTADRASSLPASSGSMVAYVREGVPRARIAQIEKAIRTRPEVASVRFVPREQGLQRMRSWLGPASPLVQDVDPGILPDAFEITLDRRFADRPDQAAARISAIDGLGDVRYSKGLIALAASSFGRIALVASIVVIVLGLSLPW